MDYNIRVEWHDGQPLAVVRRLASLADLKQVVPEACGAVWNVVRSQRLVGAGRHVSIYWDDQINLDVGVELESPFDGHGEVVGSTTPAGLVAATAHLGPYGQLPGAHKAVRAWCQSHGYALAGPFWEVYGHWMDEWNADPSLIRTEIFYLLTEENAAAAGPGDAPDDDGR